MSSVEAPNCRHYPIGYYDGAIAEFDTAPPEHLKVESFIDEVGIHWTTNLPAAEVPAAVANVVPGVVDIDVFMQDDKITINSDDIEGLLRTATPEETIRLAYTFEPDRLSKDGLKRAMVVAWRIQREDIHAPYQLGVLMPRDTLEIPNELIAATATENVRATPDLLDRLIKITADASSIWTD